MPASTKQELSGNAGARAARAAASSWATTFDRALEREIMADLLGAHQALGSAAAYV